MRAVFFCLPVPLLFSRLEEPGCQIRNQNGRRNAKDHNNRESPSLAARAESGFCAEGADCCLITAGLKSERNAYRRAIFCPALAISNQTIYTSPTFLFQIAPNYGLVYFLELFLSDQQRRPAKTEQGSFFTFDLDDNVNDHRCDKQHNGRKTLRNPGNRKRIPLY